MDEFKNETNKSAEALKESFRNIHQSADSVMPGMDVESYAIAAEHEVIKRFKLKLRNGNIYSVPYSLLPVIILINGSELVIKTYGVHITIKGRNLDALEEYLSAENLQFVRENPSRKDDGKEDVFISDILVAGKAMKHEEENENE